MKAGFRAAWLALLCFAPLAATAGWIEDRVDPSGATSTIIHVRVYDTIFPDPAAMDAASQADAAAIRDFTRRFPAIFAERYRAKYEADPARYGRHNWSRVDVELHKFSGIRVEGVESDLMAIAGGVAPDVLYVNFRRSDTYIQQGFLYPLDRLEDGYVASMTREELDFRVHERIWPVIRRKGPRNETHVWALPYGGALGKVLLYRKDLFDAAGVPYPDAEWTWDDLYDACRRLSDPGRGVYGIRFGRGKHESWYWINFLWSAGGEAMVYDESADRWDVAFDSREAAVALDFYTRLCTEPWTDAGGRRRYGYAHKDPSEASVKWDRGQIAMMLGYVDGRLLSTINPDVTGMAPVPLGPSGARGAELNSRMMGLFAEIREAAVRDAAWEFIRYFDGRDAIAVKTRVMVEGGLGRFLHPDQLAEFGYPEIIRLSPRGWADTFRIAIETGKPEPYGRHSNIAYDLMTVPIQRAEQMALNGELPGDEEQRIAALQDLLGAAAGKARRVMLGELTPREKRARTGGAWAFMLVVVPAFALLLRRVVRTFTPAGIFGPKQTATGHIRKYAWGYALLLPAALTIAFWQYVPLARGAAMAFQDYRLLGGSAWTGLQNFGDALWSADWWRSVWNALRYSLLVIALTFLPPLILAILLQEVPRGKILFRTIFYLPAVASGLVVILLWKSFYEGSEAGMLNNLLMRVPAIAYVLLGLLLAAVAAAFVRRLWYHELRAAAFLAAAAGAALVLTCAKLAAPILAQDGIPPLMRLFATLPEPFRWLGDPDTAMLACVLPLVWAGVGPGCLIYLAALKSIADEMYEAADLDGASFVDKILFIVFPMLRPLLIINFVGAFIHAWFHAEANILAMTGGAAGTEVAGLHIFYQAFIFLRFGPATAMAWMLACMLIGFTVYQLRILSRLEFRTVDRKQG